MTLRAIAGMLFATFLSFAWLGYVVAANYQDARPAIPPSPLVDPCATGETPCDPNRPWMRGTVEKYCGRRPSDLERMRREMPLQADRIMACDCQHTCDPFNDHAEETGMRAWDGRCQARCNPKNCQCPDPCES